MNDEIRKLAQSDADGPPPMADDDWPDWPVDSGAPPVPLEKGWNPDPPAVPPMEHK